MWQDERIDINIRSVVFSRILRIVEQGADQIGGVDNNKARDTLREHQVAIALENLCYRLASSREEYLDEIDLPTRLHRIAMEKAKRKKPRATEIESSEPIMVRGRSFTPLQLPELRTTTQSSRNVTSESFRGMNRSRQSFQSIDRQRPSAVRISNSNMDHVPNRSYSKSPTSRMGKSIGLDRQSFSNYRGGSTMSLDPYPFNPSSAHLDEDSWHESLAMAFHHGGAGGGESAAGGHLHHHHHQHPYHQNIGPLSPSPHPFRQTKSMAIETTQKSLPPLPRQQSNQDTLSLDFDPTRDIVASPLSPNRLGSGKLASSFGKTSLPQLTSPVTSSRSPQIMDRYVFDPRHGNPL